MDQDGEQDSRRGNSRAGLGITHWDGEQSSGMEMAHGYREKGTRTQGRALGWESVHGDREQGRGGAEGSGIMLGWGTVQEGAAEPLRGHCTVPVLQRPPHHKFQFLPTVPDSGGPIWPSHLLHSSWTLDTKQKAEK